MNNTVALVKCSEYNEVRAAVDKSLELIGGIEKYVKKGDNVVIKPNYVSKKNPDEAVTTHPAFLHAVIAAVERAGGNVTVAESPGGPYNTAVLKSLYAVCGADKAAEGTNAVLNYDTSFEEVKYSEGVTVKSFPIIKPIIDADVIISLPKLKTHAMTSYTGAVKNLFGTIPGTHKAEYHFRLNDRKPFCSMLVDLCEAVKPTLAIMDGVWGMEGDGPTAGENRHIGLVLASANSYALDMAACHIIGYKPHEVDTVQYSIDRGLCPKNVKELDILGEDIEKVRIPDFKKPKTHFDLLRIVPFSTMFHAKIVSMLRAKPAVDKDKCVGCGVCAGCCPPKAIEMKDKKPNFDMDKCIRCFCCHELCPQKAIEIKRPLMMRLGLKLLK